MAFTAAFGIGAASEDGALMALMTLTRMDPGPTDFDGPKAEKWHQHCLQLAVRVQDCPKHPQIQQ